MLVICLTIHFQSLHFHLTKVRRAELREETWREFNSLHYYIMDIELYVIKCHKNTVTKSLYNQKTYSNCIIKETTNLENMTITIQDFTDVADVVSYNYAYIPKLSRFYFINNFEFLTGGRINIQCNCDLLMSFKSDILQSYQLIERQEFLQNRYIVDSNLPIHQDILIEGHQFGDSVTNNDTQRIVLKTCGKVVPTT